MEGGLRRPGKVRFPALFPKPRRGGVLLPGKVPLDLAGEGLDLADEGRVVPPESLPAARLASGNDVFALSGRVTFGLEATLRGVDSQFAGSYRC